MAELKVRRRHDGSIGLMGHVIANYPNPAAVRSMIAVMAAAGAEVIEIQMPFSEPMADGPLFLAANHAALASGVTYADSMQLMTEQSAAHPGVRFVFMTYLNILFKRGYDRFAADAAAAGAAGLIVPDLPLEAAAVLDAALASRGLTNIRLIAPNCPEARLPLLTKAASGLIYAVARRGVTGGKTTFGDEVGAFLQRIRAETDVPVAVGFGVRSGDDILRLRGLADLAVIGTASLQSYQDEGLGGFQAFWDRLRVAASA